MTIETTRTENIISFQEVEKHWFFGQIGLYMKLISILVYMNMQFDIYFQIIYMKT